VKRRKKITRLVNTLRLIGRYWAKSPTIRILQSLLSKFECISSLIYVPQCWGANISLEHAFGRQMHITRFSSYRVVMRWCKPKWDLLANDTCMRHFHITEFKTRLEFVMSFGSLVYFNLMVSLRKTWQASPLSVTQKRVVKF